MVSAIFLRFSILFTASSSDNLKSFSASSGCIALRVLNLISPSRKSRNATVAFFEFIKRVDGIVDEYQSLDAPVEEIVFSLDREKALAVGASTQEMGRWFSLLNSPSYGEKKPASLAT
jgi:hypothetical protein